MIFLLVVAIIIILLILLFFLGREGSGWVLGLGLVFLGLIAFIASSVSPPDFKVDRTDTHSLQALGTRESGGGYRYYLSAGYSGNGQPGFNYIREEGEDEYVMRFANNYQATVHPDEQDEPYVDVNYWTGWNTFWVPWPTRGSWYVDFHVPEDAISNDISVAP